MEMKEELIVFMKQFLEFCYTDLEDLTMIEKRKWAREISTALGFLPGDYFVPVSSDGRVHDEDWETLKATQQELLENLNWIYEVLGEDLYLQVNIPYAFTKGKDSFVLGETMSVDEKIIIKTYRRWEWDFSNVLVTKNVHLSFEKLLRALDGLPIESLLRCPHCNKIFFNPTKRKKKYCSKLCQNAAGVQRYREKQEE